MKYFLVVLLFLATNAAAQEDRLIAILRSDASIKEKTDACRELARVGTREAVPVLASLLADETLSTMARYALEPIADPSVDATFRDALGTVKGRLLVGVVYSLGVRKDTRAVEPIARLLTEADPAVAQTAARTLGSIGAAAAPSLLAALPGATTANRLAICEGLFRCAEGMPGPEAAALYDKVRALPDLPLQARIASWTGAIRSRAPEGLPLLVEAIRGRSSLPAAHAIRIAMDLPGVDVTKVLIREIAPADQDTQTLLIQALGYRGHAIATRPLAPYAQRGPARTRVAAMRSLVQLGDSSSIPVLVSSIKDPDPTVSNAAQSGLFGFPGKEADAAVVGLLKQTDAKIRVAAMEAVSQRRITAATPLLINATTDADANVAGASFKALGELAEVSDIPGLVDALSRTKAVAAAEASLAAICSRQTSSTACVDQLVLGLAKAQGDSKLALLRALGAVGGAKALAAVRGAAAESDESVKETALRMLCDWPTADALPDLARISGATGENRFKILALRGQLRLIPSQSVHDAQKLAQVRQILPLLEHAEEKRVVLAILADIHTAESLALVVPYLGDAELKEEASVAAVGIGEKIISSNPEAVAEAMKRVGTSNDQLGGRARKLLQRAESARSNKLE